MTSAFISERDFKGIGSNSTAQVTTVGLFGELYFLIRRFWNKIG